ncbi:MAG: hypothetical protein KF886_11375 [Candidatus Hydrogenedentes bacterium]|nr:hypothetical protein [Candidatus Hydrogenedentota bacterium]
MQQPFSKRHCFGANTPEITIWEDAPEALRSCLLFAAKETCDLSPSTLRGIVCQVLRRRPDPSNWSEYPNIWGEVENLVYSCDWFCVYDIVEAVAQHQQRTYHRNNDAYEHEINDCLREMGIGWQLVDGHVLGRGEETYERIVAQARDALNAAALPTAHSELAEALNDLSRRPDPDLSGAVHHAMAALECVARELAGQPNAPLGKIIADKKHLFPRPLDEVLSKAWGYASEHARHGREERNLSRAEAQLIVGLASSASMYLIQKFDESES